jgi:hypothetical protein
VIGIVKLLKLVLVIYSVQGIVHMIALQVISAIKRMETDANAVNTSMVMTVTLKSVLVPIAMDTEESRLKLGMVRHVKTGLQILYLII